MLNRRKLYVLCAAFALFSQGCTSTPEQLAKESPMLLLIGDGGVRIEQSHNHSDPRARAVAAFKSEHGKFKPSKNHLKGFVWADESSEFEVIEDKKVHCDISIAREALSRQPSSDHTSYIYKVSVRVKDGLKDSPFEGIINGESEGVILFGEYPLNDWQSTENLILDETAIASWVYEPTKNHYEIVKKMGETRYLKKVLKFDPYLQKVTQVHYHILKDIGDQVDQQMALLAKLSCS